MNTVQAAFDRRVARVLKNARGIALRLRPFLASEQQRVLVEVARSEDPRLILREMASLLLSEMSTWLEVERYLDTLIPSVALEQLRTKIALEWERLIVAEFRYEVARRKRAAESPTA